MPSFQAVREEEVASLMDSLVHSSSSSSSSATSPVDLTDKVTFLAANMIFRIAFGKSFQGSEFIRRRFLEVVLEANRMINSFFAADVLDVVTVMVTKEENMGTNDLGCHFVLIGFVFTFCVKRLFTF